MGFIERTYTSTIAFISAAAETQYGGLAAEIASTATILMTILAVLVVINMGLQLKPVSAGETVMLLVKLSLVTLFLQSWSQFNGVYSSFNTMFNDMSGALLSSALGSDDTTNFARELDDLSNKTSAFANVSSGRLNVLGGVMNALMVFLIGTLGAFSTLALIIAQVILAVLLGIAPLAILAALTPYTKSFFESWMSAVIMMLLYPLILAGIFATVLAMGNATISTLDANADITIGTVIPVVMVVILSIILVGVSPLVVSLISGSFQLGALSHVISKGVSSNTIRAGGAAGRAVGGVARGAAGGQAAGSSYAERGGAALGRGGRAVAADTANFARNPSQNIGQAVDLRAAQLNRMSARVAKFSGRK